MAPKHPTSLVMSHDTQTAAAMEAKRLVVAAVVQARTKTPMKTASTGSKKGTTTVMMLRRSRLEKTRYLRPSMGRWRSQLARAQQGRAISVVQGMRERGSGRGTQSKKSYAQWGSPMTA
mmetsp:Transcript_7571/g.19300  ORF Transcript_7571/g.19300 Transcript_7571/m.19300 type:complete len:119 (+) Transcript_7571:24-380(+)